MHANWNITEKQDRFNTTTMADIVIANPENPTNGIAFVDNYHQSASDIAKLGLEMASHLRIDDFEKLSDITVIECPVLSSIKIGQLPTASTVFLYNDSGLAYQEFIVDNDWKGTLIGYTNTPETSDTPKSQEILDHMLNSVKFLQ
ncbi:MAG: hypothetical protein L0H53_16470 [Candidatus Nitrosocosmicus sp.]|nr:hypothetical protein [Candidatus Nitrosocosmicus sp.]MDN5867547.1 hypothetical protein [Candidatus Nitrosocosmicus sp.]